MGLLALKQSGIVYQDTFSTATLDSRWEIVPNDLTRISLTDNAGFLRIKHGVGSVYLFFQPLTAMKQYVIDIKNSYNPLASGDIGGLVVFGSTTDYLSLEEYYDSANGTVITYPWVRLVRDFNNYSAYWSEDGLVWNILGTQTFDNNTPKVGLFLNGGSVQDLDIDIINIYVSTSVIVGNLISGMKVELLDNAGAVINTKVCRYSMTTISFDMSGLGIPFTGRFRITTTAGTIYLSEILSINGGDSYMFEPNVDLYYVDDSGVDQLLDENMEQFLGYLNLGSSAYKDIIMKAKNQLAGSLSDITIALVSSHGTNQYTRYPKVALDTNGVPDVFSTQVTFPLISTGQQKTFWLRLSRETDPLLMNDSNEVYFGFSLSSTYTT